MFLEINFSLVTVLLLNAFIVEPRKNEFRSGRVETKITRRGLLRQRNDPELGRWRNDSSTGTISCQRNNTLIVSGSLLKLSDIPLKPDRKCNGIEAKIIELFATEKVIIDEDFIESGEELTFIIIAPTWEVVGNRKIVLDGSPGAEYHQTKAKSASALGGYDGANGKPGLPGGRGGNFYGIGKTFINGENLLISANGGHGGSGQDGGDGADGIDAPTYQFEVSLDGLEDPQYRVESTLDHLDPLGTTTTHYVVHGQNGTVGGKGGDGGCGGEGGANGQIMILNLNDIRNSFVRFSASDGSEGPGGAGGKGGKGGSNARTVKFTHQNIHSWSYFSSAEEIDNGYARDGRNGMASENRLGLRLLNDFYPSLSIQSAISDFKFFAMWYLLDSTDDATFRDFYNILLNDKIVENWNTVSGFQVEASYIEQLYTYSKKRDLLLPFVKSLKQRIFAHLKNRKVFTESEEKRNIFESVLLRFRNVDRFQPVTSNFVNHLDVGFKSTYINDIIFKFDFYEKLDQQMKLVKRYFKKISSILSEEVEAKIDEFKRESDEKIERLITESSSSKDITDRKAELNRELIKRFALENILFLNLALKVTNIKVFVNCMLKLNYESRFHLFADTDFTQFIFPRNVQETYQEMQIKYRNYISKRVAIIKRHQAFVEKQKQFANDEEIKALDNLSSLLEKLSMELKSFKLIRNDPFKMEGDILLKEKERLKKLSKGSINYSLVIQVIKHLKLHSLLGEIFGDSYERFTNDKWEVEIKEIIVDFKTNFSYNKLRQVRKYISREIFYKFDNNWIWMGMAADKTEATQEIDFNLLKSNFDSLKFPLSYGNYISIINFTLPIKYLKAMQSQSPAGYFFATSNYEATLLECYELYNKQKDYYLEIVTQYRQYAFPFATKYMENFAQHLEKETTLKKDWKDVLKSANIFDTNLDTAPREKLNSLNKKMQNFIDFSSRNIKDEKIFNEFFNNQFMICDKDNAECPSLYTWKNEMHKKQIADLLSREAVTLKSVIGPDNLHGVKFGKVVGIEFRSDNKTLQEELAHILKDSFSVVLSHHGDSHYKCEHDVYVITSKTYSFTFYFDDFSSSSKSHYEQFLLSPFATWTMQIRCENCGTRFNGDFTDLEKYKDFVDIALIGEIYYQKDFQIRNYCNDDLQKYYRKEGAPVEPEFVRNLIEI